MHPFPMMGGGGGIRKQQLLRPAWLWGGGGIRRLDSNPGGERVAALVADRKGGLGHFASLGCKANGGGGGGSAPPPQRWQGSVQASIVCIRAHPPLGQLFAACQRLMWPLPSTLDPCVHHGCAGGGGGGRGGVGPPTTDARGQATPTGLTPPSNAWAQPRQAVAAPFVAGLEGP